MSTFWNNITLLIAFCAQIGNTFLPKHLQISKKSCTSALPQAGSRRKYVRILPDTWAGAGIFFENGTNVPASLGYRTTFREQAPDSRPIS